MKRIAWIVLCTLLPFWGSACVSPMGRVAPLRLGEEARDGDAAYRASMRLVLDGLDADAQLRPGAALASYERSLQVDPSNPWSYLALARHSIANGRNAEGLAFLDKAEASLEARREDERVRVHLIGLRGAARGDRALLSEAAAIAPGVWGDGRLEPAELR